MSVAGSFDAIVVGSGITGGWAAKELTEKGLKVLMIERGRMVEHQTDYTTEALGAWELPYRGMGDPVVMKREYPERISAGFADEWNHDFFAKDSENPFQTPAEHPFLWVRGYQLGGKSLIWGRQSYRWSEMDFAANGRDGHGVDWPIRYADIAPWYDHVEEFAGISGSLEGLPQLPDGKFQPPMQLNYVEKEFKKKVESEFGGRKVIIGRTANMTEDKEDRSRCQYRNICSRGCSYGAYFSTLSSTLPAAQKTGNLTILPDSRVVGINYDPKTKRATGVRVINSQTRSGATYEAKLVFLCAATLNSVQTLLLSANEQFPTGLGNSSGMLGRGIMDHAMGFVMADIPGYHEHDYYGFRPTMAYIPRFRNVTEPKEGLFRGYGYQTGAYRAGWRRGLGQGGVGNALKEDLRHPGGWQMMMVAFAECLPRDENHVRLDQTKLDPDGVPQLHVDVSWSDNERALISDAVNEGARMIEAFGGKVNIKVGRPTKPPGGAIHEMGGARMGRDPKTSVVNRYNQLHDVPNVFVTDGAQMSSSACQNPSLTYMAMTARASANAVDMLKEGKL